MTEADVAELFAMLTGAFPNAKVTPMTGAMYRKALVDLDRDRAAAAVLRLANTAKYFPAIAEIRAAAVELEHGPRRAGAEAWGDVGLAVRRIGRYREPTFDDPLVAECVASFGWLTLCDSTNDVADRARFIELYDQLAERGRRELVAGPALALPAPKRELPKVELRSIGGGK
jgi:hypothetical protein